MHPPRVDVADLVGTHQTGLWRYLRFLGCSAPEAEDLVQETFLAVLRRPFDDLGAAPAAAYLRSVARNLLFKARARAGREMAAAELDRADAVWKEVAHDDGGDAYVDALRGCLERLDAKPRRALELQYEGRRSRSDIATALEMSEDGIKSLQRRTRALLRACIETRLRR